MNKLFVFLLLTLISTASFSVLRIDICTSSVDGSCGSPCVGSACPVAEQANRGYIGGDVGTMVDEIAVGDAGSTSRVQPTASSSSAPAAPSAPSTAAPVNVYVVDGGTYDSQSDACDAYGPTFTAWCAAVNPAATCVPVMHNGCCQRLASGDGWQNYSGCVGIPTQLGCSDGYSFSGVGCTLSDPRAAAPDGNNDFIRDESGYHVASAEDADHFITNASLGIADGGHFKQAGVSHAGQPVHVEIIPASDGGSQVIVTAGEPGSASYGPSGASGSGSVGGHGNITQSVILIGPGGQVLSTSHATGQGVMTIDGSNGTATIGNSPSISAPGTGGTGGVGLGGGISAGLQQSNFPSDYAKQGTQQGIKDAVDKIKDELESDQEVGDPNLPTIDAFKAVFFSDTFTDLLAWRLPAHTSACPVGSFSFNGQAYSINAHCQLISDHWGALQAVMTVVFLIGALFIVLKA